MSESMSLKWIPVVDEECCTGCGLCVEACGPACLTIINGVAALTQPDICGSEEHCIPVCEEEAIKMAWIPVHGDMQIGKWRAETA